jgi:hypothetical protein
MADTVVNAALEVERWSDRYFKEFVRTNRFTKYQGQGQENIIVLIEELGREAGQSINVPLAGRLSGAGVKATRNNSTSTTTRSRSTGCVMPS